MIYANSFSQFNEANSNEPEEPIELFWYYGIADCHGLESFIKEPNREVWTEVDFLNSIGVSDISSANLDDKKAFNGQLNMMQMRCSANMQRHPVIYRALMETDDADMVQDQLDSGDYIMGLKIVKANSKEIQLARGTGRNLEKEWSKIPNPELDPMHG